MRSRLVVLAAALSMLALPASASAAVEKAAPQGPQQATVKIQVEHLRGGKAQILSKVPVSGTVRPFAPKQRVDVTFYLNGKKLLQRKVKVSKGVGESGRFKTAIVARKAGKYAVSAHLPATATLRGDRTVRKSWKLRYPGLSVGECGPIVVSFKQALRSMGYIANGGRCFRGKTARGVLAYRKVNDMTRSTRAGAGLVKKVFSGRGAYKVRHPGAGRHVEAPLSKQVLVFIKGGKPYAIYPTSSGTSATPTVTGRFTFHRTEPGYNNLGMYYSWYFYGGYAIHGYKSVPNYPASHGCLRTFIADQPKIYNTIRHGEEIFVW